MTGCPRRLASSRCSTDAKKLSASAWRIVAPDDKNICSHTSAPKLLLDVVRVRSLQVGLRDEDVAVVGNVCGGEQERVVRRGAAPLRPAHPVPPPAVGARERDRER